MNRFRALVVLLATAVALLLSCSKPKPDPASGPISVPAPSPTPQELNLFAWSEYVPQAVLDGFTKETGIKVNYEAYSSNEELVNKLVAGGGSYDVIQPSEYTVELLAKTGRLRKLDGAKIPNARYIAPELTHLPHDLDQAYSVPYMTGTVGIVVNTEKVKDRITGYRDVFVPKYKGRIVVVADNRELVTWAMATIGLDPNSVTTEALSKVKPILARWIPLIKVFDSDSPKTALLNGDVYLGVVWSGEAALLYQKDKKFAYVLPAEGAHRFIDSLCIPTAAKNVDGAHRFLDYVLRPEVSALISEKFPYTNPNLEARKRLPREALDNPASYPPGDLKLATFRDVGKMASDIDKLVTELRATE
jgi:spermidine/putrescine transport system substrate-binding protein